MFLLLLINSVPAGDRRGLPWWKKESGMEMVAGRLYAEWTNAITLQYSQMPAGHLLMKEEKKLQLWVKIKIESLFGIFVAKYSYSQYTCTYIKCV